jgi:hypothetical protein
MSPDVISIDEALAALTGTPAGPAPETALDANLLRLRLTAEAKGRGISWAVIGRSMGVSGKEAKRQVKALARETQRDLMLKRPHQVRRRGR